MNTLEQWLIENSMNIEFQKSELCRQFNLQMDSAHGIISFSGGDGSPVANYVVGKTFNFNLEEIIIPEGVSQEPPKSKRNKTEEVEPEVLE